MAASISGNSSSINPFQKLIAPELEKQSGNSQIETGKENNIKSNFSSDNDLVQNNINVSMNDFEDLKNFNNFN